jgi:hypothetical protein
MKRPLITWSQWLIPALALGLFSGRVLSEQWGNHLSLSIGAAILLTSCTTALALLITHNTPWNTTWPLLLLIGYIVYPLPNPAIWQLLALATAVCYAQLIAQDVTLTLPPHQTRLIRLALLTAALLVLYITTLAPGLLPADSGEFQLIAVQPGVAHPPGFPLYTLLAHLFTRLPLGATAAWRVNLLSTLTSSATLLLIYHAVYLLTRKHLAALTAVAALATATTFWAQATTANIRSLTTLFTALALTALIHFYLAVQTQNSHPSPNYPQRDRWLILFAFALSLGFTHHLSLAFIGLIFALGVPLIDSTFLRMPRRWLRPFLATLLGLLPLLYLPLRASETVRGASPSLATWPGFTRHALGLGFQGDFFYFTDPLVLAERLRVLGNVFLFQFQPLLLIGMGIGLLWLLWRQWKLGVILALAILLHTLITAMYRAPQTVEYMMPAYVLTAVCLGTAAGLPTRRHIKQRPFAILTTALLLITAFWQGVQQWPSYRTLHHIEDARDYAQNILQDAPANATILANWHWVTPLWYLQEVEGQRPDVAIRYIAPAAAPYGVTWAEAISAELANGRNVIATWYDAPAYAQLPPPEPLHEAFWFRQEPRTALPPHFIPLDGSLNDALILHGYHLATPTTPIWQETILTVAWQPIGDPTPIPLNAHLIGFDGRSYAQSDQTIIPQTNGLTLTQFRLTPRPGALPGDYAIRLGSSSATTNLATLAVTPMNQPPATQHPVSLTAVAATPPRRLIGYDADQTLNGQTRLYYHWQTDTGYITEVVDAASATTASMPTYTGPWGLPTNRSLPLNGRTPTYIPLSDGLIWLGQTLSTPITPGSTQSLPQQLTTNRPLLRDYVLSVRMVGYEANSQLWAWCDLVDSVPAMGAIPTLKWITGSHVTSPHLISYPPGGNGRYTTYCQSIKPAPNAPVLQVDAAAYPGQTAAATLVLYDAFTQRPLPILDERITSQTSWIPLGTTTIEK